VTEIAAEPKTWAQLGLSPPLVEQLLAAGYRHPTPVQSQAIPLALQGKDLLASAQTGTGKTAAFVLPTIERFAGKEGTFVLILSPTREIALQTHAVVEQFGKPRGLRSAALIGGVDYKVDEAALATYPQYLVATPGRLCDHLERGNVWLEFIKVVILDEADRMLDMGFADQLSKIMRETPDTRQTLLFSATFPPSVEVLARKILHHPERVAIGRTSATAATVTQHLRFMKEESKNSELLRLIENEKGSIIVFVRSKDRATRLWRTLHSRGIYDANTIHSDKRQSDREQALNDFREGKCRILIATDVAGRGIHVDDVAHVVNYDIPLEAEDYVHRIGRTGRKGASGQATSFATGADRGLLRDIERMLGRPLELNSPDRIVGNSNEAPSSAGTAPQSLDSELAPSGQRTRRRRRGRRGGGSGNGGLSTKGGVRPEGSHQS
jgi:superfamily II DNA/RNA helicase